VLTEVVECELVAAVTQLAWHAVFKPPVG
jgi:hypothetical protein